MKTPFPSLLLFTLLAHQSLADPFPPLPVIECPLGAGGKSTGAEPYDLEKTVSSFQYKFQPTRAFHANGGGAHGVFLSTHDLSNYTTAAVFTQLNKNTSILTRFSTQYIDSGAPDNPINPPDRRGMAVRFYTEHGNLDIVGSNKPVFPIRDPAFFIPLTQSRGKPINNPFVNPNVWWQFTADHPETTMELIQLFSDYAYPDGWRHLDAGTPDVLKFVNKDSFAHYIKVYFRSNQDAGKNFTIDHIRKSTLESNFLNLNYAQQDLYKAIQVGNFPTWTVYIQAMTLDQARVSEFDPFDTTKMWPVTKHPLIQAGILTLFKNPTHYFDEIESAAFCPGNLVPGIEFSPCPVFLARVKTYPVSHARRLGKDFMNITVNRQLGVPAKDAGKDFRANPGYTNPPDVPWCPYGKPESFSQPAAYYKSLDKQQKKRLVRNLAAWLRTPRKDLQDKMFDNLNQVSPKLVKDIKAAIAKYNCPEEKPGEIGNRFCPSLHLWNKVA